MQVELIVAGYFENDLVVVVASVLNTVLEFLNGDHAHIVDS